MTSFNKLLAMLREDLETSIWLLPSLFCLAAVALAVSIFWVEDVVPPARLGLQSLVVDVAAARHIHGVIATSMIGVAGVTFSVTMVALTLTSGQYGPKVVRHFLGDNAAKVTLGMFLATALYSLSCLVLYTDAETPYLSTAVSLGLTVMSLAAFIYFIHKSAVDLQADQIVQRLGREFRAALDKLAEQGRFCGPQSTPLAWRRVARGKTATSFGATEPGYVQHVDYRGLLAWCRENDCVAQVRVRAGDFVLEGSTLLRVFSRRLALEAGELNRINEFFLIGRIRTSGQDPEYSISQINQLAARALSPGICDPGTAISCVDGFSIGLAKIVDSDLPSKVMVDEEGEARLLVRLTDFPGLLKAIYTPLRQMARSDLSVMICLLESLSRLAGLTTRTERLGELAKHGEMIWREVDCGEELPYDLDDARPRLARLQALTRRFGE